MFSGNFIYLTTLGMVTFLYSEILFGIFYKNIWKQLKDLTISTTKTKLVTSSINAKILNFIFTLLFFYILTQKSSMLILLLPALCTIYIIKSIFIKNSNHMLVISSILVLSTLFTYVNNFILFFIFLEFYSIVFYFYLLNQNSFSSTLLIRYKNNLLLYLFNNFIISIFFMFFTSHVIYVYGTVNFRELCLFSDLNNNYFIFLILTIIIKLSLPGMHYLKIEMYKYIELESVILFSVTTLFINFLLINFLTSINMVVNVLSTYKLIILLLPISIVIIIQKLKINTFNEFIAYSGFVTNNLILLNFVI